MISKQRATCAQTKDKVVTLYELCENKEKKREMKIRTNKQFQLQSNKKKRKNILQIINNHHSLNPATQIHPKQHKSKTEHHHKLNSTKIIQ